MDNEKRTPWFPQDVKPVREGLYEVMEGGSGPFYSFFDGEKFMHRSSMGRQEAMANRCFESIYGPSAMWRGLAEQPKD